MILGLPGTIARRRRTRRVCVRCNNYSVSGGRPTKGNVAAKRSRTAILGLVAARTNGQDARPIDRQQFLGNESIGLATTSINEAFKARRFGSQQPISGAPEERDWIREAYEIDATKIGLIHIVAWLPRPPTPLPRDDQAALLIALRKTEGVVGIQDCIDDTIIVTAMATSPDERVRLQRRLRALCPSALWAEIRETDRTQAARGWLGILRRVADQEGLRG